MGQKDSADPCYEKPGSEAENTGSETHLLEQGDNSSWRQSRDWDSELPSSEGTLEVVLPLVENEEGLEGWTCRSCRWRGFAWRNKSLLQGLTVLSSGRSRGCLFKLKGALLTGPGNPACVLEDLAPFEACFLS